MNQIILEILFFGVSAIIIYSFFLLTKVRKKQLKEPSSKLIYLASPYSHVIDEVRVENYKIVSDLAAKMASDGHVVFSPITYGHHLTEFRHMPTDWLFWMNFCLTFLAKSDEMIVYKMEGWDFSTGVREEIKFCEQNNIPITYIDYEKEKRKVVKGEGVKKA